MKILELFGGIGACTQAFKRLGIPFEVADYVEIDKYAVKSYNAINDTNFETQDITKWDKDIEVDFIMHGSPCQDFSIAGKQAGGDEDSGTRSSLMYETIRIVESLHPKYVVWENVKNLLGKKHKHNFDNYLEIMDALGYNNYYQVLNSKDYGIPQNRERVYTISIRKDIDNGTFTFPEKEELKLRLKDMLEDEVDEKYYLETDKIDKIAHWKGFQKPFEKVQGNNSICPTLTARGAGEEHNGMITYSDLLENTTNMQEKCLTIKSGAYARNVEKDIINPLKDKTPYGWHFEQNVYSEDSKCCRTVKSGGGSGNIPKVIGGIGEKKSNGGTQWYQQDRIYDNNVGLSVSTTAIPYYPDNQLRIRKLTPKECWRLMGFSDECFEKAEKVNSNAQLYKQAGNSIVVDVLYKIFKNLFNIY